MRTYVADGNQTYIARWWMIPPGSSPQDERKMDTVIMYYCLHARDALERAQEDRQLFYQNGAFVSRFELERES